MKKNKVLAISSMVIGSAIAIIVGYFAYQIIDVAISTNPDKICQIE